MTQLIDSLKSDFIIQSFLNPYKDSELPGVIKSLVLYSIANLQMTCGDSPSYSKLGEIAGKARAMCYMPPRTTASSKPEESHVRS